MVIRADVLGASLDAGSMKTIGGHACCSARAVRRSLRYARVRLLRAMRGADLRAVRGRR